MSVVIETTIGDITVDLFLDQRPRTCLNFLKLCRLKYYNFNLFHTIQHDFIAQTGDPTGSGHGGSSVWGIVEGLQKRFFQSETAPKIRHADVGLISMVSSSAGDKMIGSQFFFTLGADLFSLDDSHCVFGEVVEGLDVLRQLNETICDDKSRPYKDVRVTHTVVLNDPFENPRGFREPSRSPSPSAERLKGGRIAADEDLNDTEGKTEAELTEMVQAREAKAQATILEIVGDLPDAEMAPPENVLFVCKLNPVTSDDDLEIIFSRFGRVKCCEVIRDKQSGDSLQYAFVEFEEQKSCEDAYLKMDNVLIDDRRIHVDFSQSVAKLKWQGKGRGVIDVDGEGRNGRGGGGGPRINFNDKNWKNGQKRRPREAEQQQQQQRQGEGGMRRGRSRSPDRREERERRRERSMERKSRNSPMRREFQQKSSSLWMGRRSRSRSSRPGGNRGRDGGDRRGNREEVEMDRRRRREENEDRERDGGRGRRDGAGNRSRSNRSRSRSHSRRSRDREQNRDRNQDRRPRSRDLQSRGRARDQDREGEEDRYTQSYKRPEQRRQPSVEMRKETQSRRKEADRRRSRSASSSSSSSSDDSDDHRRRDRKKASKKSKQKRNKKKKSKVSRTSSDSSSTTSEESDEEDKRKHSKKNKKKHKKAK